jgi:hypothetical protein
LTGPQPHLLADLTFRPPTRRLLARRVLVQEPIGRILEHAEFVETHERRSTEIQHRHISLLRQSRSLLCNSDKEYGVQKQKALQRVMNGKSHTITVRRDNARAIGKVLVVDDYADPDFDQREACHVRNV